MVGVFLVNVLPSSDVVAVGQFKRMAYEALGGLKSTLQSDAACGHSPVRSFPIDARISGPSRTHYAARPRNSSASAGGG